jgi:HEAT repeat protein
MNESGPEVRAAALRARSAVQPQEDALRAALADPSPVVQATAAVGLVAGGWPFEEAHATLRRLLVDSSAAARRALARAIERQPGPAFEPTLLALSYDQDPVVLVATAQALGKLRSESALPALLTMLRSTVTRSAARHAFAEIGPPGLGFLREALADATLPQDLRRHIPRTISKFPPADAAPTLLGRLLAEEDGMVRFKILRGLGRIVTHSPAVHLDPSVLRTATERTLAAAFRLIHWRQVCEEGAREQPRRATSGHALLVALFRDKEAHASERVFRLLGLRYRSEDFANIHRGLRNTDPKVRAGSRELIENIVRPPLRDDLLALADGRLPAANPHAAPPPLGYEELLATLLDQPGETLRCLAAHHVGELRLVTLRERIEELREKETALFVGRVFERTLRELADPTLGAPAHA